MLARGPGAVSYCGRLSLAQARAARRLRARQRAAVRRGAPRGARARTCSAWCSHDLRTPLSVIAMCATALLGDEATDAARDHETLETIQRSAHWAQRLIQDLLDVSAIDAGGLSLASGLEDPHARLARRPPARQAGHRAPDPARSPSRWTGLIDVDADRIVQALGNLDRQRPQVHAVRRHRASRFGERGESRAPLRHGQRTGDPGRGRAARVRPVLDGGATPRARDRDGAGDRARDRRRARRVVGPAQPGCGATVPQHPSRRLAGASPPSRRRGGTISTHRRPFRTLRADAPTIQRSSRLCCTLPAVIRSLPTSSVLEQRLRGSAAARCAARRDRTPSSSPSSARA